MSTPSEKIKAYRAKQRKQKSIVTSLRERIRGKKELIASLEGTRGQGLVSERRRLKELETRLKKARSEIKSLDIAIAKERQAFPVNKNLVEKFKRQLAKQASVRRAWRQRPDYKRDEQEFISLLSRNVMNSTKMMQLSLSNAQTPMDIEQLMANMRITLERNNELLASVVSDHHFKLDEKHRESFRAAVNSSLGKNFGDILSKEGAATSRLVSKRISENIRLIKSIPEKNLRRVGTLFRQALNNDISQKVLYESLQQVNHVSASRAKLIARDQTTKALSDLDKSRQENIGVTRYRWASSDDARVRPEHAENDGKIFEWDTPPPTGHPGTEVNCRCVAIPILEDLL